MAKTERFTRRRIIAAHNEVVSLEHIEGEMNGGGVELRLQAALAQEATNAATGIYSDEGGSGDFVSSYERDKMVQWLRLLTHDFHFCLEVFFRASNLLDTFLSLLKVRHRFLECVTATCFYVATKLEERTEAVSSMLDTLVDQYECECTQTDIQRMELVIMQKLEFNLTTVTPLDFLKIFHVVGVSHGTLCLPEGISAEQHLCHVTLCLEAIVTNHLLMRFRPSLLALAVLGCDLKLLGCDWLSVVVTLQSLANIRGGELSVCYEAVAPHYGAVAVHYPLAVASDQQKHTCREHTVSSPVKAAA